MKYKVCSMLLAAALAFSLWPVSARADALEKTATLPGLSEKKRLPQWKNRWIFQKKLW